MPSTLKRPWLTKEVVGWAMFDFANQAFTIVVLTTMFHVYFVEHVIPPDADGDHSMGRRWWATCGIITQIVIIVLSPLIGALADFSGAKKKWLLVSYIGCVTLTLGLSLVGPGDAALGIVLFILAYLFYGAGENFLSAFLPELATHRDMGKVSAFSWTLAYTGALLALGGAVLITALVGGTLGYRLTAVWASLFFMAAGFPTFLYLRERKQAEKLPPGQTVYTIGFHRLAETFREIRQYRWLFRYLAVMTIYFGGVQIVYWFAGTLTKELFNFNDKQMGLFILQITVTAIIGAAITARYQDRIGTRITILVALGFWTVTMLTAGLATREWVFWAVGNLVGLGVGAIGTASRVMVGLFSPPQKAAEFFGFYGLAHKLAAIMGLGYITLAETMTGGRFHLVVAMASGFFIVGAVMMYFIDEKAGRVAALRAERAYRRREKLALLSPAAPALAIHREKSQR